MTAPKGERIMTGTKGRIVIVDDNGRPLPAIPDKMPEEREAMHEYVDHLHEFHPDVIGGGGPASPPCDQCVPHPGRTSR